MSDTLPLVSVVIAVRNGERYLASAIRSVIAQDYRPLEIVVVDGHSTDATARIAATFPLVRVVEQKGTGIPNAYNEGVAAATGEIVAFLSHDDEWTPDKLRVQVGGLLDRPECDYSVARARFVLEPGETPPPGFRMELAEGDHMARIVETLVARRALFDRVGGFDESFEIGEDVDWFARVGDAGVACDVRPEVLLTKRVHGTNASLTRDRECRNLLRALKGSIARKAALRAGESE